MSEQPSVTCRELITFLADYLEDALAPERRVEFDRHLAECPSCVDYLSSYRETIVAARSAYADVSEDDLPADLVRAILAAVQKPPS